MTLDIYLYIIYAPYLIYCGPVDHSFALASLRRRFDQGETIKHKMRRLCAIPLTAGTSWAASYLEQHASPALKIR